MPRISENHLTGQMSDAMVLQHGLCGDPPKQACLTLRFSGRRGSLLTTKSCQRFSFKHLRDCIQQWFLRTGSIAPAGETIGCSEESFFSCSRMIAFFQFGQSFCRSLVTKVGTGNRGRNCIMPSTNIVSVVQDLCFSSTVITLFGCRLSASVCDLTADFFFPFCRDGATWGKLSSLSVDRRAACFLIASTTFNVAKNRFAALRSIGFMASGQPISCLL